MAGLESLLPKEYGYVVLVLVHYVFFNFWMGFEVGKARKKYKVFYPTLYATEYENKDAKLFNCVQRGHQKSLEIMHVFFMLMKLGGMKHPCVSAVCGLIFIVARYFYFTGYATGDPEKRISIGIEYQVPNLIVGAMTKESLYNAFNNDISAGQIMGCRNQEMHSCWNWSYGSCWGCCFCKFTTLARAIYTIHQGRILNP